MTPTKEDFLSKKLADKMAEDILPYHAPRSIDQHYVRVFPYTKKLRCLANWVTYIILHYTSIAPRESGHNRLIVSPHTDFIAWALYMELSVHQSRGQRVNQTTPVCMTYVDSLAIGDTVYRKNSHWPFRSLKSNVCNIYWLLYENPHRRHFV